VLHYNLWHGDDGVELFVAVAKHREDGGIEPAFVYEVEDAISRLAPSIESCPTRLDGRRLACDLVHEGLVAKEPSMLLGVALPEDPITTS